MAKRSKTTRTQAANITIRQAPAAPMARRRSSSMARRRRSAPARRRRRSVGGGGGGGGAGGVRRLVNPALAGGAVGLLIKSGLIDKLPAIPVVGRIGAGALALSYFGGRSPLVRQMADGMAFLAGYQLTSEGSIHGDDDFSTMGFDTMGDEDEDEEVLVTDDEG